MIFFFYSFIVFLSCLLISYLSINNDFGVDKDFNKPQSIHNSFIPRIMGFSLVLLFFPIFFEINLDILYQIFFISIIVSFPSLLEDFNYKINPYVRTFYQFITLSLFLIYFDNFTLSNIEIFYDIDSKYFLFFFTLFALIGFINGLNFIDGINGLLIIYALIITTSLVLVINDSQINVYLIFIIIHLFAFLYFNFPKAQMFIGDFGVNFLAVTLALLSIYLHNVNSVNILFDDWYVANLFCYPIYEISTSIIRRVLKRRSPFYPDKQHLHSLLFEFINLNTTLKHSISTFFIILLVSFFIILSIYSNISNYLIFMSQYMCLLISHLLIKKSLRQKIV